MSTNLCHLWRTLCIQDRCGIRPVTLGRLRVAAKRGDEWLRPNLNESCLMVLLSFWGHHASGKGHLSGCALVSGMKQNIEQARKHKDTAHLRTHPTNRFYVDPRAVQNLQSPRGFDWIPFGEARTVQCIGRLLHALPQSWSKPRNVQTSEFEGTTGENSDFTEKRRVRTGFKSGLCLVCS